MTVTGAEQAQVTPADLASFTRQLGAMLDAGVDVLRALRIAARQTQNPYLMEAVRDISRKLEDGREFHVAITAHAELFDPFYVEMARQGEAEGVLGKSLLSVADYLDRVAQQPAAGQAVPAAAPVAAAVSPLATAMLVLGVQAVGAALIWGVATATPEILPMSWLGPIAALWVGVCLLSGGWILTRLRHPVPTISPLAAGPAVLKLPPKSTERKNAETDAVVRNALMEQQEDREERSLKRMLAPGEGREKAHGSNGTHAQNGQKPEDLFEPGGDTPRFEL